MKLKNDLLQIKTDLKAGELAIGQLAGARYHQNEKNKTDQLLGDREREMNQLTHCGNTVFSTMGTIAQATSASAEYQQQVGEAMNIFNSGVAIVQAAASIKAGDPFTYLALLGTVLGELRNTISQASAQTSGASIPSPPGFATGTDREPGGLSIVGETGPELVNLPEGAQVVPSGPSRNLLFGNNAQLDFGGVPDLSGVSGGSSNRMMEELSMLRKEMAAWPTRLRVESVQTDFDIYTERRDHNRRRVRNVKS